MGYDLDKQKKEHQLNIQCKTEFVKNRWFY